MAATWVYEDSVLKYKDGESVIATISGDGLSNASATWFNTSGNVEVSGPTSNKYTVTLKKADLGITLMLAAGADIGAGNSVIFALDADAKIKYDEENSGTETVEVSNGTVTVKGNTTEGFVTNGTYAIYTAAVTDGSAKLATISGFNEGAIADNFSVSDQALTVNDAAALKQDETSYTLTTSNLVDGYTAAIALNQVLETDTPSASPTWTLDKENNKLVYGVVKTDKYAAVEGTGENSGKYTVTYTASPAITPLLTIAAQDDSSITFDESNSESYVGTSGIISIDGNHKVTLSQYAEGITVTIEAQDETNIVYSFEDFGNAGVSTTGATLDLSVAGEEKVVGNKTQGYTSATTTTTATTDNTTTTYKTVVATARAAETNVTLATIAGLNSNKEGAVSADTVKLEGKTITISKGALSEDASNKVTLTTDYGYSLALGDDVTDSSGPVTEWRLGAIGSGDTSATANYTTATRAYYTVTDGKEISYTAEADTKVLVSVSGLKIITDENEEADSDATLKAVKTTDNLTIADATEDNITTYTVTLKNDAILTNSDVVVSTNADNTKVALAISGVTNGADTANKWTPEDDGSYAYHTTTVDY